MAKCLLVTTCTKEWRWVFGRDHGIGIPPARRHATNVKSPAQTHPDLTIAEAFGESVCESAQPRQLRRSLPFRKIIGIDFQLRVSAMSNSDIAMMSHNRLLAIIGPHKVAVGFVLFSADWVLRAY